MKGEYFSTLSGIYSIKFFFVEKVVKAQGFVGKFGRNQSFPDELLAKRSEWVSEVPYTLTAGTQCSHDPQWRDCIKA